MHRKSTSSSDPAFSIPGFQELLDEALRHKNAKDFTAAAKSFRALVHAFPESPIANWLLGALLFFERGKARTALGYLKNAVRADPKSERASLTLFHCLWELGRVAQALDEMKRFQVLTNWRSRDYRQIAAELRQAADDQPR